MFLDSFQNPNRFKKTRLDTHALVVLHNNEDIKTTRLLRIFFLTILILCPEEKMRRRRLYVFIIQKLGLRTRVRSCPPLFFEDSAQTMYVVLPSHLKHAKMKMHGWLQKSARPGVCVSPFLSRIIKKRIADNEHICLRSWGDWRYNCIDWGSAL